MDEKYIIAEDYVLPSGGKIYSGYDIDPHVRISSMTIRDEMKRTSKSNTPNRPYCDILDARLLTKLPFSTYDLCTADYEYLLHKIRVTTYGPDYKMLVGCPHCDKVFEFKANLDDLKAKKFDLAEFDKARSFELPICKKQIKLKFETPKILDTIELKVNEFKENNKTADYDPRPVIKLQNEIDTVDGLKLSYIELEDFINNLSARDYNFIDNKIEKLNNMIGLDTGIDTTCKYCGGRIKTFFRFGPEFFRPTNDAE